MAFPGTDKRDRTVWKEKFEGNSFHLYTKDFIIYNRNENWRVKHE